MPCDILFEHPDWTVMSQPPGNCEQAWTNSDGLIIGVIHIGVDKELRARIDDVNSVRDYYRSSFAKQGTGLIECDMFDVEGQPAVRAIGKIVLQPSGAAYIGTIALPLAKESYVLNILAREEGITGMRETAMMLKLTSEFEKQGYALDLPPENQPNAREHPLRWRNTSTGAVLKWTEDPYDSEFEGPCLRNMGDAAEYDDGFPQHPLSRVRSALNSLIQEIKFSPELKERTAGKSRWKFW